MAIEKADMERLSRIVDFFSAESKDLENKFVKLDYKLYRTDSDSRRSVERCIENIVNASLDIAKIILIAERLAMPDTYREYFNSLYASGLIGKELSKILADGTRLRNILAHQYLDIRWDNIKKFLSSEWKAYQKFLSIVTKYISIK